VLKRGRPIGPVRPADVPAWVRESVAIRPVAPDDFAVRAPTGPMRVIGLIPGQILTNDLVLAPVVSGGHAVADPSRDLAKIAVIERHHATGRIGLGFVHRTGLRRGALASTVAHDAHNIVVIGMSDGDMAAAVARIVDMHGGIVAVADGHVIAECPLPIAGLLSDAPADVVIGQSVACTQAASSLGWVGDAPFMTLSFLALSTIPELKITDRGLVDVRAAKIVPLAATG